MGRSSKAKIERRLRQSKAKLIQPMIDQRTEKMNKSVKLSSKGFEYREKPKVNAFLEPNNPEAEFPQKKVEAIIDFRSSKNPHSGYEWRGAMRKSKPSDLIAVRNVGELDIEEEERKRYESKEELVSQLLDMKLHKQMKIKKTKVPDQQKWKRGGKRNQKRNIKF